jgi:hypothetical protein
VGPDSPLLNLLIMTIINEEIAVIRQLTKLPRLQAPLTTATVAKATAGAMAKARFWRTTRAGTRKGHREGSGDQTRNVSKKMEISPFLNEISCEIKVSHSD